MGADDLMPLEGGVSEKMDFVVTLVIETALAEVPTISLLKVILYFKVLTFASTRVSVLAESSCWRVTVTPHPWTAHVYVDNAF